jgi:hypothetical protein
MELTEPIMSEIYEQPFQSLINKLNTFVKERRPTLYILTPCYGGVCYVNYTMCLINTLFLCKQYNVEVVVEFCRNDSLVPRARNNLIAKAMTNKAMTHIIFIDADITWDPWDVIKLLLADKPLVGGVYPLKHYHFEKLTDNSSLTPVKKWIETKNKHSILQVHTDEAIIKHNLLKYNINHIGHSMTVEQNLSEVKHLATGFFMAQRKVFESMMKAFPSTKYVDDVGFLKPHENEFAYALFDCGVEEGHYFSEDWLFCHRWRNLGGKVFVDVSINLTHSGIEDYQGCFMSSVL